MSAIIKPRSSRRLFPNTQEESDQLSLPTDCELVANTFIVFPWSNHYCVLQVNFTLYCWGRRRSGAIEHVLEKYGLVHSPQLYRVNCRIVSNTLWRWLKHIFVVVHRMFDDMETCESASKVRWINIMQCEMAYDVMRRECYHYHQNLYPKGSVLTSFLKHHGVEVEAWFDIAQVSTDHLAPSSSSGVAEAGTPTSAGSDSSERNKPCPASNGVSDNGNGGGLGEREWLSDLHISNLMFLLLCGQLMVPLELRDHFQCLYPMTDHLLEAMLNRMDPTSLLMHAKESRGVALIFVNPNNNHWRLIVVDGMQRQVVLFDPLGVPFPSSLSMAVRAFVGSEYVVMDMQSCVQAEGWNCGIWSVFMASKYVIATVDHLKNGEPSFPLHFQPRDNQEGYIILNDHSTSSQRLQNQLFAAELRKQYSALLVDARTSGRLLYRADNDDDDDEPDLSQPLSPSPADQDDKAVGVVKVGTAFSAVRRRRFIDRPLAELVWINLTDGVDTVEVEQEEALEASYDDLCDQFVEFREDNVNNSCAAALKYSLPAKLQSDVLREQIAGFREYRRQRFSLFRKGPLVEESTISGNISSLLRFLGYLHYEQSSEVKDAPLDMSVFELPNINVLMLKYVEWLEQRRGNKPRAAGDTTFQSVSCATVANYLNGLVSTVKFQLRHNLPVRDSLLDQLRNLRSQAESYSMTQKTFEKVHPQWCTWQELQIAREKCRAAFDQQPAGVEEDTTYLLRLHEVCLLGFLTICPPPRCSIIRLLEWNKTLLQDAKGCWMVDLSDLSHAATRHKTHKLKGAMLLPLSKSLFPYLVRLHRLVPREDGPVFPARLLSRRASSSSAITFMSPTPFTNFVKATFQKYTDNGKGPSPSLLRSIFTTWLYGLRYDTEDTFLQEIKSSSAKWKAHTELVASTVYNKELIYQQKQFNQLLMFCESYSHRFAYDRDVNVMPQPKAVDENVSDRRRSRRKRNREVVANDVDTETTETEYVVEALLRIRDDGRGQKEVRVRWEGYKRETWEPYDSMKQQLPEMMAELEMTELEMAEVEMAQLKMAELETSDDEEGNVLNTFLRDYITKHGVDSAYRWRPDRLNTLELAAESYCPPVKLTARELRKRIMALVSCA